MDNITSTNDGLRELALFAGAGGGILGGKLLGWETVCAVEWNAYAASVLVARQNDKILPPFPIWDDVQTFDGRPWRGIVDVVSGGFPCQDISSAGKGAGITGERSGMWSHMARIIGEVRPRYAFIENSPMLTARGLDRVLCDLAEMGYNAEWGCISAGDCGALHERNRIWIVCYTDNYGQTSPEIGRGAIKGGDNSKAWKEQACESARPSEQYGKMANASSIGQQGKGTCWHALCGEKKGEREADNVEPVSIYRKWPAEPNVDRVVDGVAARMERITAIGNGQVPIVAARAFNILASRLI